MSTTIYGSFDDAGNAEKAVGALLDYGVRGEDISLVSKQDGVTHPDSTARASDVQYDTMGTAREEEVRDPEDAAKSGISTTTPADAGVGAAKGAGVGLGVGAIAALASLFLPGIGFVLGGGALAIALGGAAATTGAGAVAGAVTGYLKDQGMDEPIAQNYEKAIEAGGALVAVSAPSGKVDESVIRSILNKYAASNINDYANTGSAGFVA